MLNTASEASVTVSADTTALRALGPVWTRLAETGAATPFQTYAWNLAWWELVGERSPLFHLHVVTVTVRGRVALIAPLMVEHTDAGARILRFLSDPWGDYQDVVTNLDGEDLRVAFTTLNRHLEDGLGTGWDEIRFTEVRAGSRFAAHLITAPGTEWSATDSTLCPTRWLGDGPGSGRNSAGKLARARRLGEVRLTLWNHAQDIRDRLPDYTAMHVRQWYGRPDCGITFTDPEVARFYLECPRYLAPAGLLGLAELTIGTRPAAFYFGFLYRGTFWGYRPAYETQLARLSPGRLLHQLLFQQLAETGFHTFDMMRGDFAYKQTLATDNPFNLALTHSGEAGGR
ncbi:GNAT family N-acetyltransferase [Kitasatospora sp. NPDC097643]|uniref:GNAT family N-acetyltransferase n=1 Tax=Kitasatospora sp. NPDC097643 TaxID=3157230 RepID=UPI00332AC1D2